jgi:Tol biopolymer transport system component
MGEVYRARDTRLGRDVAIKILPESFASDPERLARFEREARTLAQLNHPNIAQVHGFDDFADHRALVMELVNGEELSARTAKGPIPLDEARSIARQIADALAAAHNAGIVHRDLKPANVKVREDGTVKVLDFGLAKLEPGGAGRAGGSTDLSPTITSPAMTAAGIILGTAAYMSPEQAKGRPVDKRADIWAFGCVLYEMLTGRRVFAGDDISETLATILKSEPDWAALPPDTPSSIRRLLKRALAKQPSQRLADISDARLELDDAAEAATSPTGPAARGSLIGRLAWFAAGMAITVAVGFIAMPSRPANRPTPIRFSISYEGPLRGFAVSPDGQTIAYAATGSSGRSALWTRRVDSETSALFPGTEDAWQPFWSPDGRSIAFFTGRQLRRIDVSGRAMRTICETGVGPNAGARGSWGDAGLIVYAKNFQAFSVPAEGGEPTAIKPSTPITGRITNARAVPGQRVLLIARDLTGAAETWSVRLDGSDPRKLADAVAEFVPPDHLLVARPDEAFLQPIDVSTLQPRGPAQPLNVGRLTEGSVGGDTIALQSRSNAIQTQLEWFDRAGKPSGVVGDVGDHYMPRLSPDGTKLAVESHGAEGGGDLFIHDLKTATRTRLTFEPSHHNAGATWSTDGSRLAFHSTRQQQSVFVKPVSGASPETLVLESDSATPVDWSADGRFLLIDRVTFPSPGIYRLPLSGSSKPEPVLVDPNTRVFQGQLSPDGTLMAYVSEERAGGEVFVSPFPPTGAKWQVSTSGGHSPRWNRNGKELFYISPGRALMSVPINVRGTFSNGTPVLLFQTSIKPITSDWFHYDVAPDGQRFIIVSQRESGGEHLHVIVNWRSLLPH